MIRFLGELNIDYITWYEYTKVGKGLVKIASKPTRMREEEVKK